MGYSWALPSRKRLTPAQKRARVAFARTHLQRSWDQVWNFDEAYFNLYRTQNRCWIRVSRLEIDERTTYPKLRGVQEKISVVIGAAISRGRKSSLLFLDSGWNAEELRAKFHSQLFPSLHWSNRPRQRNELALDNDSRHKSNAWTTYVAEKHLRPIDPWPSNSPDLAPIENVFSWMKTEVEHAQPSTRGELASAIRDAWQRYPQSFTNHLMDSMPARLEKVLERNGGRIRY